MARDTIVYDLETKETFQMIGERDPRKLHISMLGMYSYNDNSYFSFTEDELPLFWRRLEDCSLLVGFNNKGFDDIVVSAYFPEVSKLHNFDILERVSQSLGFRIKLDNLAQATLGIGKSGDGLKAIDYYRDGEIEKLRSYCLDDVKITKELYDYGRQNGQLFYTDLQGRKPVSVDFSLQTGETEELSPLNLSLF